MEALSPDINNRSMNLSPYVLTAIGIFYTLMAGVNVWLLIFGFLDGVFSILGTSYTIVNGVIAYGFFRRARWLIPAFALNVLFLLWQIFASAGNGAPNYMLMGSVAANALILFLLFRERHNLTNAKAETAVCVSLFIVFWLLPQVYYT